MERVRRKENSPAKPVRAARRRKEAVAEQEAVLGVPPVAVVEPVDVAVPLAAIAVDVENRDALCHAPSMPLPFEYSRGCI